MFPELVTGSDREALRFGDTSLTYRELARLTGQVAGNLTRPRRRRGVGDADGRDVRRGRRRAGRRACRSSR